MEQPDDLPHLVLRRAALRRGLDDDEIARLRRMEAALDRRIAAADDERRAIEERMEDGEAG